MHEQKDDQKDEEEEVKESDEEIDCEADEYDVKKGTTNFLLMASSHD